MASIVHSNVMGTLTLRDNAGNLLVCPFDKGDVSVGPFAPATGNTTGGLLNEVTKIERRGRFLAAIRGSRVFPTGKFSAWLAHFSDATAINMHDMIMRRGGFAGTIGTLGANYPTYTLDLLWHMEGTNIGDTSDNDFVLEDCAFTIDEIGEDPAGNAVSYSFEVLGRILDAAGNVIAAEIV